MSVVAFAARRPRISRVAASLPLALLWFAFAAANLETWRTTHRPVGLGATLTELCVAVLFLLRRPALTTSRSPLAWAAAAIGTFGMLGARPAYAPVLGLGWLYVVLQIAGAVVAVASVIALGRSFGLVAANRGICTRGPYRVVRHPLYVGYFLSGTGYVLENPSLRNLWLYVVVMGFQAVRIVQEERCLDADPAYRSYRRRVPRRVVPFLL